MHLAETDWRARSEAHAARVEPLVGPYLRRRSRGESHPVEDFLFTYYSYRPAHLRRWHPGWGIVLDGHPPHERWRGYGRSGGGVALDPRQAQRRRATVTHYRDLLRATAGRTAHTGCLGLHEWAMVYRSSSDDVRHGTHPLRLGHAGTDAVVETHQIRCSHFDAFRFFTDDAAPRNTLRPTRERQIDLEQPGCLHANMDLYKAAYKLSPLVGSELVVDAFLLAREIRALDMRASPYDLADLGYPPVRIETRDGKAEYVGAQRRFAERAAPLRARLLAECDAILATIG